MILQITNIGNTKDVLLSINFQSVNILKHALRICHYIIILVVVANFHPLLTTVETIATCNGKKLRNAADLVLNFFQLLNVVPPSSNLATSFLG